MCIFVFCAFRKSGYFTYDSFYQLQAIYLVLTSEPKCIHGEDTGIRREEQGKESKREDILSENSLLYVLFKNTMFY